MYLCLPLCRPLCTRGRDCFSSACIGRVQSVTTYLSNRQASRCGGTGRRGRAAVFPSMETARSFLSLERVARKQRVQRSEENRGTLTSSLTKTASPTVSAFSSLHSWRTMAAGICMTSRAPRFLSPALSLFFFCLQNPGSSCCPSTDNSRWSRPSPLSRPLSLLMFFFFLSVSTSVSSTGTRPSWSS